MIYVFLGNEFNIIKKKIEELINTLNIDNIIKYDFSESSISEILNEVNYVDLFNEKKLIIVSNFSFKKLKEKEEKDLLNYIDNMNDNVIIIKCIDESLDSRKSITKIIKEKCKLFEMEKLDYKSMMDYITNMFKENNIKISYNQIKKILDLCENNIEYAIKEVEKLLIYKIGEKEVSDKDIDDVISKSTEKEIFNLTDNVMKRDIAKSIESFNILISSKIDATVILETLSRQFRLLYQTKILSKNNSESNISKMLLVNPYVIKKTLMNINNFKEEEIIDYLYKLSNIDIDIKTKGYDKNKVLESFFLTL